MSIAAASLLGAGCWEFEPREDAGPEGGGSLSGKILVAGGQHAADPADIRRARARIAVANARADADLPAAKPAAAPLLPVGRPVASAPVREAPSPTDKMTWREGEVLVLFERGRFDKESLGVAMKDMVARAGLSGVRVEMGSCAARRFCLVRLYETAEGGQRRLLALDATTAAAKALHAAKVEGVRAVARNFYKHGLLAPNDPFFFYQWHYEFARIPAAWDITTGSDDVVVAVIDSGIVRSHPDVIDRLEDGVDMIEDPGLGIDGNGRDTDPSDPGDNLFGNGQHSFHGTHVTGTIGATSNNGQGVAGVMWASRIVPVRVLGNALGGTDSDILSGLFWAVGEPDIDGVVDYDNPRPAKVINMSLGGVTDEQGTQIWQEIIDEIVLDPEGKYGKPIIVAAAGNSDAEAATVTPANLDNVITVGATRLDGKRASYSNRGAAVDLMAPGGEVSLDQNADGFADGVLSLYSNEYNFEQGTSMAAPHVAGIVGLVVSIDPTLDSATVEQLLKDTADPSGQCNEGCGAGHVDASAALIAAGGAISPDPRLSVATTQLFFGQGIAQLSVSVRNIGNAPLDFTATVSGAQAQLFTAEPTSGTVPATGAQDVVVRLARGDFGAGSANLEIVGTNTPAPQQRVVVNLSFDDGEIAPPPRLQTVEVGAYEKRADGIVRVKSVVTTREKGFAYAIEGLKAGSYFVFAVADEDNDGVYDPQRESVGAYPLAESPKLVVLENDGEVTGLDFALASGFVIDNPGGVGAPCTDNGDCTFAPDAECITDWAGGYCSRICAEDGYCGANASCENLICGGGAPCAVCLASCVTVSQCRAEDGFVCDPFDTCTPVDFN